MYKRIVVPLDGSELAESALNHVKKITEGRKIDKLVILRIVEPLIVDVKDYIGAERVKEAEEKMIDEAKNYLKSIEKKLKEEGYNVKSIVEISADPAAKILEVAKEEDADLIVMSTHGRTGFRRWIFGSVAHKVLAHSNIAVLIAVPEGEKSDVRW